MGQARIKKVITIVVDSADMARTSEIHAGGSSGGGGALLLPQALARIAFGNCHDNTACAEMIAHYTMGMCEGEISSLVQDVLRLAADIRTRRGWGSDTATEPEGEGG